ncbi:acetyltransferase [Lactobacillus sp. PV037]|uniref:acyltransferase family protein n=1 Tax=unclassified Lactobacillus TaxID=2620435 RepID=UPI00223FB230|nr:MULTISPECIES: acyltransferase family protein [unclassified Lactobacillus]QNQ82377.1 acetyltransferase [Lactobacillus sp. PV012]QNQ83509.1 acetyltransferase [Lactobacillus sp. PV037]
MKNKNRFITGYAGLRALAVIGVILYHLDPNRFIGGYLGVPIFLVLSGYLVTDHMFHAYEESGKYDTKGFYLRRIKKLYPQMIAVIWMAGTYILLFQRNLLAKLYQIVITNLLNVYNIWEIFNGQSYFERFAANESPFVHLWTMSIEGQFYILWPLVIWLLMTKVKKKKTRFWIITALTIFSALEMAILFKPGVDTSRIYYGSDTRFFSLGLGAMLAIIWPTWKLNKKAGKTHGVILDLIGALTLILILWMTATPALNPQHAFPYRGGMFIFSFLTMILVAVIAHPSSHWNAWLTNPLFKWIGSRSYGIYLYQFPIMIFFEDKVKNIADHVILYRVIEVALILIVSELTYRYIEKPFGKLTVKKVQTYLRRFFTFNGHFVAQKVVGIVSAFFLVAGSVAILKSPAAKAEDPNASPLAKQIQKNRKQQLQDNKKLIAKAKRQSKKTTTKNTLLAKAKKAAKAHPVNKSFEKYGISQEQLQLARQLPVTAIGDSVMAGSSENLKKLMPHAIIDAAVSRQLSDTIPLFEKYKAEGVLNKNVLVGLGTNGMFPPQDLEHVMQIVGKKRRVFWVNVYVPTRTWQKPVNNLLQKESKKYKNLYIINWNAVATAHPNWFYDDHTHPNDIGSKYYSSFITKELVEKGLY